MAKFKEGDLICPRQGKSLQKKIKGVLKNAYVFTDDTVLLFADEEGWEICMMPASPPTSEGGSRAEQFIKDFTRNCSNELVGYKDGDEIIAYNPWLSPVQALRAVEIAREEIYEWLEKNAEDYSEYPLSLMDDLKYAIAKGK